MKKFQNKQGVLYYYQAAPQPGPDGQGYWCIQRVNYNHENRNVQVHPMIDWLTREEALRGADSGHPFRELGEASRRRGPYDLDT